MLKKHDSGYPIHIIMEKPTGKTMDCYVEFPTHAAAYECVRRFEHTAYPGRGTKLGTRNVSLDLSNQTELVEAVFPRARLVEFDAYSGRPTILPLDQYPHCGWSEGFRGYFTLEEIYGITRFAECPSRSPFVLKCHQRVYESMITTLYKFPWAAVKTYTIRARNALFEAAYKQLGILSRKVGCPTGPASDTSSMVLHGYNGHGYSSSMNSLTCDPMEVRMNNREVGLSQSLLFDLLFATVNVPGFSLLQKLALCQAAGSYGRGITLHSLSETWPFQTLEPAPGTPDHIVKFWLELFDTGFDIMTFEYEQTGFEEYLVFERNMVGFPIAIWTPRGVELSFKDAIQIETAVVMCYVSRGRQAWAAERQIDVQPWKTHTFEEVMTQIAIEKHADREAEKTQARSKSFAQTDTQQVSPKTVGGFRHGSIGQHKETDGSGPFGGPSPKTDSKLNAATATSFVPASVSGTSSSEGGVGIDTGSSTSGQTDIWGRPFPPTTTTNHAHIRSATKPAVGPPQLKINTKVANTSGNAYAPPGLSGSGTTTNFTNPFTGLPRFAVHETYEESLTSAAISPRQTSFGLKQPTPPSFDQNAPTRHRSSIVLTGISRPPGSQDQATSTITDTASQLRNLSLATTTTTNTTIRSPEDNNNSASTQHQYPSASSFSSTEQVTPSSIDDPFSPAVPKRIHTVPDIAAARYGASTHHQDFGIIGSGTYRSGSSSNAATAGSSSNEKVRAQSIPVTGASGAAGSGYIRGEHGDRDAFGFGYGYGHGLDGRLSAGELWGGGGGQGQGEGQRRYRQ